MSPLLSIPALLLLTLSATNVCSLPTSPAVITGSITAVGIGVASLDVTNKFYSTALDFGKGTRMSFPTWDEDIMGPKAGGPAIIPMKFNDKRPTKDLPVKLQFSVPDSKAVLAKIVAAGGLAVDGPSAASAGTLYAKDPDGYLIELVISTSVKGIVLSGVGYGSSDHAKSAAFFAKLAGTTPNASIKTGAWDVTTVPTKGSFDIQFVDFHDQRPTKSLPLKIVWGASSIEGFQTTITSLGGGLIKDIPAGLDAIVGLGYDPVDQILMEVNPENMLAGMGR